MGTKKAPFAIRFDASLPTFCLVLNNEPCQLVEIKYADDSPAKQLINFAGRYRISAVQIVLRLKREQKESGIEVRRAMSFLESLFL